MILLYSSAEIASIKCWPFSRSQFWTRFRKWASIVFSVFVTLLILVCNRSYPCVIFIYGDISKRTLKNQSHLKTEIQNKIERVNENILKMAGARFRNRHKSLFIKVINILDRQITALEYKNCIFYNYLYISKKCLNPIITVYGLFTTHSFSVPTQYSWIFFKLSA